MTTKEYLSQIFLLSMKVKTKRQQAAELRDNITGVCGIDYSGIKVQTSPKARMQETIDRLVGLEEEIARDILEMELKKEKVIGQINQMKNPAHIQILKLRYIDFLKWEEISEIMGYSTRQVYRLHGKALREFRKENKF